MIEKIFNILHLHDLGLMAAVEIIVLSFLLYRLLLLIKGTRAVQMLYGVIGLMFISWITGPAILGLSTIHRVLVEMLVYIPFAVIVVFQNTIRRALTGFGANPLGRYIGSSSGNGKMEMVVSAAYALAGRRVGALIVIEREQGLRNWTESGISLDALISFDLIVNVFSPYTPLHDGALVIADGRLKAASCFLPLTSNPDLSTRYGTRHRAAIGITEETDAVSIVISEERGEVSLVIDGVIHDNLEKAELRRRLLRLMEPPLRRRGGKQRPEGSGEADEQGNGGAASGGERGEHGTRQESVS